MTIKALYQLFQKAQESMSYDVDFGIGTPVQQELRFQEDDYRLPFIWFFPPVSDNNQYPQSIASGTTWNIGGFVAVEDDIDATDEERLNSQLEAGRIIADFVGQLRLVELDDNNYFNNVNYNMQASFRETNAIWSGMTFTITGDSDNLYDFCC